MDILCRERQDKLVPVNHIIPFSAVDGPGNRTTVFLQGCNINCKYCHNPETRTVCIACMECVDACPVGALYTISDRAHQIFFDKSKCVACDTCIHVCKHGASPRVTWMSAEQVFDEITKQIPFIRGVTVSGGECMLYPEFIQDLFSLCKKEGLSTLIDSNGTILFEHYPQLLSVTDGVMLDIKAYSLEDAMRVAQFDNSNVLENASYLASVCKLEELRTVVVEELFDAEILIRGIAEKLKTVTDFTELRYKLITYRPFGVREEYKAFEVPTQEYMEHLALVAKESGFEKILII